MTEVEGRRRNSLLACLVHLRRQAPDITVSEILAFLYAAENPGIRIKELSELMQTTGATASRASRALLTPGDPGVLEPGRGWLLMASNGREAISRHLYLTDDGMALIDRLNGLIGTARLVAAPLRSPASAQDAALS